LIVRSFVRMEQFLVEDNSQRCWILVSLIGIRMDKELTIFDQFHLH
jgi:hypothetical protein